MKLPNYTQKDLTIYPKNMPKILIHSLIIGCLLLGLSAFRNGRDWQNWLNVFENWLFMLIIIPTGVAICALPFKLRDNSFELKLAYYLGMFVAFIYTLNRLRYWH